MFNDQIGKTRQTLEKAAQECGAQVAIQGPREMLLEKAEALRREAHDLETLARNLPPQGVMPFDAERALRDCVAARIYR